jgi:hypothetical protein
MWHSPASQLLPPEHALTPVHAAVQELPLQATPVPQALIPEQHAVVVEAPLVIPPAQEPMPVHATSHVPVPLHWTAPLHELVPEQVTAHVLAAHVIVP